MKKLAFFFAFSLLAIHAQSQTVQEIATGAGYQKQSFISLSAGTEKLVNNTAWDIAFTVFGQQDAGVFVNESSGSSMGAANINYNTIKLQELLKKLQNAQPPRN